MRLRNIKGSRETIAANEYCIHEPKEQKGKWNEVFGNDKIIDLVGIRPPEIFTMGKMLDEEAMCYTVTDFVHAFC